MIVVVVVGCSDGMIVAWLVVRVEVAEMLVHGDDYSEDPRE